MKTTAIKSKVVWMEHTSTGPSAPKEKLFEGALNDAMSFVTSLAKEADFLMGQVLAPDGRVVANIAPGGLARMNDIL